MQTKFDAAQLADPATAAAAGAIRNCVHCGFCTATCPTYVLLGNELDSPRGRIYLVKEMLEKEALPSAQVVKHLDRCLSCLACETTCPSGVSYRRIIDKGRAYVDAHYRRPLRERLLRGLLAVVLPHRGRFRIAMSLAAAARPLAQLIDRVPGLKPVAMMLRLSRPMSPPDPAADAGVSPPAARDSVAPGSAASARAAPGPAASFKVGMLRGCVEAVLDPAIQAAATRLIERMGGSVVRARGEGCCGALPHHMGREAQALAMARANVDAWQREMQSGALDAIVVTASGCGTVIRDYGFLLRDDPAYAAKAAQVSALACDITELVDRAGLPRVTRPMGKVVAYHAACSLQHGQKVRGVPDRLLRDAGFEVRLPVEAHLCCGSAGVYNILQPEIADQLGKRKAQNIEALSPDIIAAGNIGCMMQIGRSSRVPVVHVAQLLDWATGGPRPLNIQ